MPMEQRYLDLLQDGARQLGITLQEDEIRRLSIYLETLLFWSPRIDLVSQHDPAEIIRKHFLDSLAVVRLLPAASAILDLGSGAGFPGIPLAFMQPQIAVALVETRRKRISFLREVNRKTGAQNLTIHEGRAEELAIREELHAAFDVVITRATWSVPTFLRQAAPFLRDQGLAMAMQGPHTESGSLQTFPLGPGEFFQPTSWHEYTLPFGSERRLLLGFTKQGAS
ncbi:MAG: 16S rRNA (guanine(527)-N(7))-methyltransferase RsmG [Deltaproteobacteria bacterium]|nr:16S rRNA (guanine(527)-N(7))-methyltransferase RsmG [Deltaproteobacteria bacterium]